MAKGVKVNPLDLVRQAMSEAKTRDPGVISLQIEEIIERKMEGRRKRYMQPFYVYQEFERYGISKYSDVVKLVDEAGRAI